MVSTLFLGDWPMKLICRWAFSLRNELLSRNNNKHWITRDQILCPGKQMSSWMINNLKIQGRLKKFHYINGETSKCWFYYSYTQNKMFYSLTTNLFQALLLTYTMLSFSIAVSDNHVTGIRKTNISDPALPILDMIRFFFSISALQRSTQWDTNLSLCYLNPNFHCYNLTKVTRK